MLKRFIKHHRYNETLLLMVMTAFCVFASLFRIAYTRELSYIGLNWNLFLAFVPWALSSLLIIRPRFQNNRLIMLSMLTTWLLFYPNAPYILTDLFHLRERIGMPIWYDMMLIMSFAWTGLLFGFFSLWDIEAIIAKRYHIRQSMIIPVVLLFIGSFGVYLGRELRWNSWDLLTRPQLVLSDIVHRFIAPQQHLRAWGMTLFMGTFLCLLYWSLQLIKGRKRA
jgi:uncharacterized membrane protein